MKLTKQDKYWHLEDYDNNYLIVDQLDLEELLILIQDEFHKLR